MHVERTKFTQWNAAHWARAVHFCGWCGWMCCGVAGGAAIFLAIIGTEDVAMCNIHMQLNIGGRFKCSWADWTAECIECVNTGTGRWIHGWTKRIEMQTINMLLQNGSIVRRIRAQWALQWKMYNKKWSTKEYQPKGSNPYLPSRDWVAFSPALWCWMILNLSPIAIEAVNYLYRSNAPHCRWFDDVNSLFVRINCRSMLWCTHFLHHSNGHHSQLIDCHRAYWLRVQTRSPCTRYLLPFHQSSAISLVIYLEIQIANQNHRQYWMREFVCLVDLIRMGKNRREAENR